jgi:hypothetical protein
MVFNKPLSSSDISPNDQSHPFVRSQFCTTLMVYSYGTEISCPLEILLRNEPGQN